MQIDGRAVLARLRQVDGLLANNTEAHIFQKRHTLRQHNRRAVMIKLQRNRVRTIGAIAIEVHEKRGFSAEAGDTFRIDQRFRRGKDFAIGWRETRRKRDDLCVRTVRAFTHRIVPCANNGAHFRFQRFPVHMRRGTLVTADDELNARQAVLQEYRMEFKTIAAINIDQIMPDLLTHDRVVTITRNIDQNGGKATKAIKTRNSAHTRTFTERQNQLGIRRQAFHINLEKLITRIFFQHTDKRLA